MKTLRSFLRNQRDKLEKLAITIDGQPPPLALTKDGTEKGVGHGASSTEIGRPISGGVGGWIGEYSYAVAVHVDSVFGDATEMRRRVIDKRATGFISVVITTDRNPIHGDEPRGSPSKS